MSESKNRKQPPHRLEIGTHGGCEASLFEFSEKQSPEPEVVRIAAVRLDEALACLRWHEPNFEIESVRHPHGSGSPDTGERFARCGLFVRMAGASLTTEKKGFSGVSCPQPTEFVAIA